MVSLVSIWGKFSELEQLYTPQGSLLARGIFFIVMQDMIFGVQHGFRTEHPL